MNEVEQRRIQDLLAWSVAYSERFLAQREQREQHHLAHRTNTVALGCMDGRVNVSALTDMPIGVVYPMRTLGGVFDLGWPMLREKMLALVQASLDKGRGILFLVTYHFASESRERGCRGHHYDVEKAIASAERLVEQFRRVFGDASNIYPILVGVDTDRQALIFHGRTGVQVSMGDVPEQRRAVERVIKRLYPDLHDTIANDLVPLMLGNIHHAAVMRKCVEPHQDLEHRESMVAIGQGFDWLPTNTGIVITPLAGTLDDSIGAAVGIVEDNRTHGRIGNQRPLLFASAAYHEEGYARRMAIEEARHLTELGITSIQKLYPNLVGTFATLTCVMRWSDRRLEVVGP